MTVTHTISKTRAKVGETVTVSTSGIQGAAFGIMWLINYTSSDNQYSLYQLKGSERNFADYSTNTTKSVTISSSHLKIKTLTPIYWVVPAVQENYLTPATTNPIENNQYVTIGETIDVSFYIQLAESIYSLGEKLATNISEKGVSASADDGLTTLAEKIDDIYVNIPKVIIEDDTVTDFADLRFTFVFPKNCRKIRGSSLAYWKNLKHCILPEGPSSLETIAFNGCSNLVEITIPNTITSIGSAVFANTTSLNKIVFKNTIPPTVCCTNTFSNLPTTCIIEVPHESLYAYKSASHYPDPTIYTYGSELFWDENNSNGTNNYTTQILLESGTTATFTTVFDTTHKAYYANITNNGSGMSFIPINVLTGITDDFKLQIDMMSTDLSDSWMALGFAQNEGNGFVYGGYNGYWEGHEYQNNVWRNTLNHNTSSPPTNNTWYILELVKEGTSITINCWDNTHTTNYSSITRTWSNGTNYFGLISDNNTYFKNVRAVYI